MRWTWMLLVLGAAGCQTVQVKIEVQADYVVSPIITAKRIDAGCLAIFHGKGDERRTRTGRMARD